MPPVSARTVRLLLGPELIGITVSYFLWGALTVQCYHYLMRYTMDRKFIKWMTLFVYFLEVLLIIITTHVSFDLLCTGWGDPVALQKNIWVNHCIPIVLGLISGIVQCFYMWRIYVLGRKTRFWTWIVIVNIPVMLLSTATAMASGLKDIATDRTLADIANSRTTIVIWLISSAICDFWNAVCMSAVIITSRKKLHGLGTANRRTYELLTNALLFSLETNALTMAGAILKLIFWYAYPNSRLFTMLGFINSKLYSNSLLASLTSRNTGDQQHTDSSYARHPSFARNPASQGSGGRRGSLSQISFDKHELATVLSVDNHNKLTAPKNGPRSDSVMVTTTVEVGHDADVKALPVSFDYPGKPNDSQSKASSL